MPDSKSISSHAGQDGSYETDRQLLFDMVYERFRTAESSAGGVDYFIDLAGHAIQLRFAGPAMSPHFLPALAHLIFEPTADPEFTICVWDCSSTGTSIPLLVSSLISYCVLSPQDTLTARNEIKNFNSSRMYSFLIPGPNILKLMDASRRLAIYWINDARKVPYYEKSNPFKLILNWFMQGTELTMLHAAAVGNPDGGVLISGKSESGKSTAALSCLDSTLKYLSDDTCVVCPGPAPTAYSLFNSGRLNGDDDLDRFQSLVPIVSNPERAEGEKVLFYLHKHKPDKIIKNFPIKAILIAQVTNQQNTEIQSATARQALLSLAPSSILQLPRAGRRNFSRMAELVRRLPAYKLELGSDLSQIPAVIADLLGRL
jgi:hypothetical protein